MSNPPTVVRNGAGGNGKKDASTTTAAPPSKPSEAPATVTCAQDVLEALAGGQFKLSLKPGMSVAEQTKMREDQAKAPVGERPLEEKKDSSELRAEIDRKADSVPSDDLPSGPATSSLRLPPFAKYVPEQHKIVVLGSAIDDPFLVQLYKSFSTALSARNPQVAVFMPAPNEEKRPDFGKLVNDERQDAYLSMAMGWFCATLVRTPMLYILLQGPFAKPRTADEENSSESPIYASTTYLVSYYRALQVLLFDAYAQQEDAQIRNRLLRAHAEKKELEQILTQKTQQSINQAVVEIFKDEKPKPNRITRERQRSKTTKEWVSLHRHWLEELGRKIRIWTIMRIQHHEAVIGTLLGLPGDKGMQHMLSCSLDSLLPEEIVEKHRSQLAAHYKSSLQYMALNYGSFPPKKKKNPDEETFHYSEGKFLSELLGQEGLAAVSDPECNTARGDKTISLAFLWIRLCTYTRLLDAQREFAEEYGK